MPTLPPLLLALALAAMSLPGQGDPAAPPDHLLLVGGTVLRTDGSPAVADAAVLVAGDRIAAVGPRGQVPVPEGVRTLDVSGRFITPGLVDAHVHFFQSGGLYTRPDVIELRHVRPYADEQADIDARLDDTLRRYVASGVTAVLDVGGPDRNFTIRERARTAAVAPIVRCSSRLLTTWLPPAYQGLADPPFAPVRSPADCVAEVDRQAALGTDLVKVWYIVRRPEDAVGNRPLLDATVQAAARHGLRVAVHATQLEAARQAVLAGAHILVHSVEDQAVDAAFTAALVQAGTVYLPTLMVIEGYAEVLGRQRDLLPVEWRLGQPEVIATWLDLERLVREDDGLARRSQGWAARLGRRQVLLDNLAAVHAAGGVVAAGTDAGNIGTLHGPSLHRELELMVAAGLSPEQVLVAATRGGARATASQREIGDVAAGMRADLLLLATDPRRDIAALQEPEHVVLGGRLLTPAEILPESPEQVVQRQVNAYNSRDLERFADCYDDDVVIGDLGPDGPVERTRGKALLRQRWGDLFARAAGLHCQIQNRITNGDTVIDHELVTGIPDRGTVHAVAVYRVRAGRIVSVWFVRPTR